MPVESAQDRASFVDPAEHGATAKWTNRLGQIATLNGIFESEYLAVLGDEPGAGIGTSGPAFQFPSSTAPGIAEGETLEFTAPAEIAGELYAIAGPVEPDGTGFTVVQLHRIG